MANSLTHAAVVGTANPASRFRDADLLRELGLRGMQRMAGFNPPISLEDLPKAAPISDEVICKQATVVQFFQLQNNSKHDFNNIWMERFIDSGQKFPNEFLPDFLRRLISFRSQNNTTGFLPLMSKRVRWLVNFPEFEKWQKIVNEPLKGLKLNRDAEADTTLLYQFIEMRQTNPEQAVQWLSDNWQSLRGDLQVDYLNKLVVGLNPNDEPFLTNLLNFEQSFYLKTVCDKAAYLLSLLEADSIQETIEEIISLTYVDKTTYHGWVLDFRWSDVFKEHPIYDTKNNLWLPLSKKYKWTGTLNKLIYVVPLEYWCQHYKLKPLELVAAIHNGIHGRDFSEAWWARLIDESREDFLRALLNNKVTKFMVTPWEYRRHLIQDLPFELFEIVVDEWLRNA